MALKFLFDECMAVSLPGLAHRRNFEAYHVAHRGLAGRRDRDLVSLALEEELIVVTNNGPDFAALLNTGGSLHPGMIVLGIQVRPDLQEFLFERVLDHLGDRVDLVNRVVEVDLDASSRAQVSRNKAMTEEAWMRVRASATAVIHEYDMPR